MHFLNGFAEVLNFLWGERTNEVLLFEEVKKADEVSVLDRALPVDEAHVAGHVVRQRKSGAAARAHEPVGERLPRRRGVLADVFHQLQRRSRRKAQVFVAIKPKSLARRTDVNRELVSEAVSQLPIRHLLCAVRADHKLRLARRRRWRAKGLLRVGLSIAECAGEAVGLRRLACSVAKQGVVWDGIWLTVRQWRWRNRRNREKPGTGTCEKMQIRDFNGIGVQEFLF